MATVTRADADVQQQVASLARAVLVVLVAFLSAIAVAGIGANLLVSAGVFGPESLAARVTLSILQFVGFGVGIAGYLAISDEWDLIQVRVPSLLDLGWTLGGLVAILLAAAAVGYLLTTLGIEVAQNQVIVTGQENPVFFLYMIPVSLLFVGPFEELVFRGTVQGLLRRVYRPALAIAIASAMFGIVHWLALTGGGSRFSYVAVAATLGLILGVVYERTGNLAVPALVHGMYNSVLFAVQYVVATGLVSG